MRFLIYIGLILFSLGSCTQRTICPAYQSAFIHDKEEMRKKFSYFNDDAEPKGGPRANKNKYLVAKPVSYRTKVASLNTVSMKPTGIMVPDSILYGKQVTEEELDAAARSVIDSIYIVDTKPKAVDSVAMDGEYMISKDREHHVLKYDPIKRQYRVDSVKYNVDQDSYMWYMRKVLILPDEKLVLEEAAAKNKNGNGGSRAGLFSFLKRDGSKEERVKGEKQKKEKASKLQPDQTTEPEETGTDDEEDDDGFGFLP